MESLCIMKAMDNFVHSAMETSALIGKSYPTNLDVMEAAKSESRLKRPASCDLDGCEKQLPPLKLRCFAASEDLSGHNVVHAASLGKRFSEQISDSDNGKDVRENLDSSACKSRDVKEEVSEIRKPTELSDRHSCNISPHLRYPEVISPEVSPKLKFPVQGTPSNQVPKPREDFSPACYIRDKRSSVNNMEVPETERCRSVPCTVSLESEANCEEKRHMSSVQMSSLRRVHSADSDVKIYNDHNHNFSEHYKLGGGGDDDNDDDENNVCDSGPPTPSSCFIDIETDTPPCSPLNLTTNNGSHEIQSHSSISNNHNDVSQNGVGDDVLIMTSQSFPKKEYSIHKLSNESVTDRSLGEANSKNLVSKAIPSESNSEKKTNFSIDAILRPDFGVFSCGNQSQTSPFQRTTSLTTDSPRSKNSIKSPHSAFTAVDLSTRARKDSLSSPSSSSSSSSPSPPLSTSSPSPRQTRDLNHPIIHDKYHLGQENFLFPSILFPNPHKELEKFIGGHFPVLTPTHGNGLGKFPFMYSPHISPHVKLSTTNKYPLSPEAIRAKPDPNIGNLQNDISKLLGRSTYPFLHNPLSNLADSIKSPRDSGKQIKPGSDATLQVLLHHQNAKQERDVISLTKPSEKPENNDVNAAAVRNASPGQNTPPKSLKDNAVSCKPALKQEKPSPTDSSKTGGTQPAAKGENPLWPAWVFCTRYSDRPSSGPRSRKPKRKKTQDEKRPRTAFTNDQLQRLKREFEDCRYLTETRRKNLADELGLTESQIKIWFQNKRAKIKKSVGVRNPLALQLMEQGLYNHTTVKLSDDSS